MKIFTENKAAPASAEQKKAAAKSTVLQTYFTSLLSLVLCVVMFFGTTYAWFTSEVNNVKNEIYIGILDVEMEKALADGKWASLSELENGVNKTNLFDRNIRWEPGYTTLETIRVVNKGDLAFRYTLAFTDGTFTDKTNAALENEKWKDVAKHFDVWVYDHGANKNAAPTATSYDQIISEGSGWMSAGSLVDVLSGKAVLSGEMAAVRKPAPQETTAAAATEATEPVNPGTTDGIATASTYTIALHMKEDADISVMGHKITMNVKLVAYQMGKETDDFGNHYDKMVATAEELNEALKEGGKIVLATDLRLVDTKIEVPKGVTAVLDLNGHTISQTKACTEHYAMINNKGSLTITGNGKISFTDSGVGDPTFSWGSYTIRNEGKLTVENGTIEHLGQQNTSTKVNHMYCALYQYSGSTTINGGKISTPTYRSARLWKGDMTINGGEFEGQVWVQAVDNSAVLTINGGSFAPRGADGSSVFITNSQYSVALKVTGGEFETKIGASKPEELKGAITGGVFSESAKKNTAEILFAESFKG